jgi:hypothetical protein
MTIPTLKGWAILTHPLGMKMRRCSVPAGQTCRRSPDSTVSLIQSLHANVAISDGAVGIMALQCKRALIEFSRKAFACLHAIGLVVFENFFVIDKDLHVLAFDNDLLRPPFSILGWGLCDVYQAVEAAGLYPVRVSVIHLAFKTRFGPIARLVLGVKINSAVGTRFSFDFYLEVKVFERFVIANVVKVTTIAVSDKCSIDNSPGVFVFLSGFPAIERLSIHQRDEAGFELRCAGIVGGEQPDE